MKLYTHRGYPDHWIGEIENGDGLLIWPRVSGGWTVRRPIFQGYSPRGLTPADPALARGTGAPGTGRGKPPRQPGQPGRPLTIRIDDTRRAAVQKAAKRAGVSVGAWIIAVIDRALDGG